MTRTVVRDLVSKGVLLVEDGNHGEYRPRPDEFIPDGVPFIRAADMSSGLVDFVGAGRINDVARARIRKGIGAPGDVILSHKGTVGRVAVAPMDSPDFVCSPQTTFWRSLDPDVLDQRFLRYTMASADFARQLDIFKGQTDMAPYVSLTDQRSIEIDIPRIADQRAIADVLGALDDKTAANARVVEAAESLMVNTVAAVDRWEPLSAIACHSTVSIKPEQFDKTVAHFSLPAFDAGADPELVDGETIKSTKFVLAERCVLFSKLNPRIPRIWNVEALPREMALASTEFVVLIPRGADSSALWATLAQPDVSEKLRQMVAGTSGSHQRIRPQDLLNVEVRDVRTLGTSAAEMVRQLSQVCYTRRQESQRLARTRDELLPLLMSGKLRVKDAENMAAEAL